MNSDKAAKIKAHAREIAALLYEESNPEQLQTLAGIETVVRSQLLEHVSPEIGLFLSKQSAVPPVATSERSPVCSDE